MQYLFSFTMVVTAIAGLFPFVSQAQEQSAASNGMADQSILIVYLSRTGNTEAIAEIIHQQVGGDLVELELETPYPEDYDAIVAQVDRENEMGYLPPLKTRIDDIQNYETVFLGFPTWDMQLPPPMKSFLSEYDLGGTTVIPFNTNGGYGLGSSLRQVESLCPDCSLLESFSIKGGLERDGIYLAIQDEKREKVRTQVTDWLRDIGVSRTLNAK